MYGWGQGCLDSHPSHMNIGNSESSWQALFDRVLHGKSVNKYEGAKRAKLTFKDNEYFKKCKGMKNCLSLKQ